MTILESEGAGSNSTVKAALRFALEGDSFALSSLNLVSKHGTRTLQRVTEFSMYYFNKMTHLNFLNAPF